MQEDLSSLFPYLFPATHRGFLPKDQVSLTELRQEKYSAWLKKKEERL
jgi:hypothetical protein